MGQNQEAWDQNEVGGWGEFPVPGQFISGVRALNFRKETWEG